MKSLVIDKEYKFFKLMKIKFQWKFNSIKLGPTKQWKVEKNIKLFSSLALPTSLPPSKHGLYVFHFADWGKKKSSGSTTIRENLSIEFVQTLMWRIEDYERISPTQFSTESRFIQVDSRHVYNFSRWKGPSQLFLKLKALSGRQIYIYISNTWWYKVE